MGLGGHIGRNPVWLKLKERRVEEAGRNQAMVLTLHFTWEPEKLALSAVLPNMCVSFIKLFSLENVNFLICKMQKLI